MSNTPVYTPYTSFSTMSRTIGTNGGSWYLDSFIPSQILGDQTVGGATGFIQLRGYMGAQIVIPGDIAQDGDTIKRYVSRRIWVSPSRLCQHIYRFYCYIIGSTLSYNACRAKADDDPRTSASFNGHAVPFCPTSKC